MRNVALEEIYTRAWVLILHYVIISSENQVWRLSRACNGILCDQCNR